VPLALAYKAVNTLDSMLGYHTERYEYFGKAAARLDDLVNLVPARLTAVALIGAAWLLSRFGLEYDGGAARCIAWRDGRKHASPNAGYPEAALAGALGVCLGGPSRYFGAVIEKPTLGEARHVLSAAYIPRSLVLLDTASVLMLVVLVIAECGLQIAD
jgi:adenosylcobinamide-phosphate synthase